MKDNFRSSLEEAKTILAKSKFTTIFTGAGISTPSGIPDFRSPGSGLWEKYDPFSVASLTAFKHTPEKFFDWIKPLYLQSQNAEPNQAHHALAELEEQGKINAIITQNIDGLHQKAGSENVIELHGCVKTATCPQCQQQFDGEKLLALYAKTNILPACHKCRRIIKPDVILYEEPLPKKAWNKAAQVMKKSNAVFVIGSSLETTPANTLPQIGINHNALLVIVTISPTPLDDYADVLINADVTKVIPELV